jgi:hypothetical protein
LAKQGIAMTLTDFATFSTAVSGLAVTASLIYLALQTHQNAKHTRALIHQGRVAALRDIFLAGTDPNVAAAFIAVPGGTPTPQEVQKLQYRLMYGAMIYGWQDTYSQYRNGLLDEDFFRQMRTGAVQALSSPTSRAVWEFYRVPGTQFAAFMDELAANLSPAEP